MMSPHSCEEIKETSERRSELSSKETSLNVKAILDSIKKDLVQVSLDDEFGEKEAATTYTIHRVPQEMRERAQISAHFVPKHASFGPVYWGNTTELRSVEIDKLKAIRRYLPNHQGILEKIINEAGSSIVALARKCYGKQLLVESLDDETLVRIMVLDGVYVILVVCFYKPGFQERYMNQYMVPDFFMLENQIPYPVLERLFDYIRPIRGTPNDLKFWANLFLGDFSRLVHWVDHDGPFHHLLHMLHSSLLPKFPDTGDDHEEYSCWYWWRRRRAHYEPAPAQMWAEYRRRALQSATQLLEAGVKFKTTQDWRRSAIDVRFRRDDGCIEIPRLTLDSLTVTVLLNLVAFEQCVMPGSYHHVTVYLAFMNCLIDTAKDVDLLVSSGVLDNRLGTSEYTANFFNTAFGDKSELLKMERVWCHYLEGMFMDLGAYCVKRRHRNWAKLERDYLSTPWSVISLIAGTLLLILTVAQTFIAYYSYFRPPKI